jgi:DNA replication protein DnaC
MKLSGMAEALQQQIEQGQTFELTFEERMSLLVDREMTYRESRRLERLLREARLKQNACLEEIDYTHRRGLEKSQMAVLEGCDWIRVGHNVVITGPTGSGKSWLACALGNAACRQGISVIYSGAGRLLEELGVRRGNGSWVRRMGKLGKAGLIILDDWGMQELSVNQLQDLMELIEERHPGKSTVVTSQMPVERWHDWIGNPTVGDAILDRLLSKAHRVQLKGESMRKVRKTLTDREHS